MTDADPLPRLQAVIVAAFPDLAGARFTLSPRGWDSQAVDVDDRLIFKFPRHQAALGRLRMEARLLAAIGPRVTMAVPELSLIESPQLFSRHAKLRGDYLTPQAYAAMSQAGRQRVADQLARFYAELHALDQADLRVRGAGPIAPWRTPAEIAEQSLPLLPGHLRRRAEQALAAYASLPPDPHGLTYGFFDGHGWNMAFDAAAERLNGIYDFGDSGFCGLHQEFIYSNLCAFDLTDRIVASYQELTSRALDRQRIDLLTGIHGLTELDGATQAGLEAGLARIERWAARGL